MAVQIDETIIVRRTLVRVIEKDSMHLTNAYYGYMYCVELLELIEVF